MMENIMTWQKGHSEAWFFDLLKKAGEMEAAHLLESDEAFDAFLRSNPLSPDEEVEVRQMVRRLAARLRGKPEPEPPATTEMAPPLETAAFAALHRKQGKSSPEVEKRLEELRAQAKAKPKGKGGRKTK
jgi:hypothetical protein